MKPHLIAIAASALFASGIGVASAASSDAMSKTPPATQSVAKDSLSLTHAQQRIAWRDINKRASAQSAPSNFTASVGAAVPGNVSLQSVPANVAARVSSLKPYDYALLPNRLLIVNPNDKKVVDVITHRT